MAEKNEPTTEQVGSAREDARTKLASMQKQQSRRQRRGGVVIGVVVALVVIAIAAGAAFLIKQDRDEEQASAGQLGVVKSYDNLGFDHTQAKVKYPQNPPVGGDHNPAWANCGVYDKVVPNENAVHSMEHGAVWITYKPGAVSAAELNVLKGKARTQEYILMSQNTSQTAPIVLSAWGKQLRLDNPRDPKLDAFLKEFVQGDQTREPGASCSGAYDPNTGQTGGAQQ